MSFNNSRAQVYTCFLVCTNKLGQFINDKIFIKAYQLLYLISLITNMNFISINVLYNTITICGTISATPASLSNATFGTGYSQLLTGTGGTAPYTFAVTSGALPSGMALTQSGTVQGSPVTSGTTITRATFPTGSGTRWIAMDLKFTSNASGPTL